MTSNKVYIIAEAGVNHNGSLSEAKKLCLAAKNAGADCVKFQTWITEKIITRTVEQAEYQIENIGKRESQFDMLKNLELSYEEFREIKEYCDEIGVQFASTADEQESLDFLVDLGMPFIKIGSGDIGNVSYLRYVGAKKLPVILSTGMSSISDIELSINALQDGGAQDITLLHCTTNYPCPYEDVNLKAMDTIRVAFGIKVGYSDHTVGIEVPIAAVAQGAKVIEKHFTLNRNSEGPDHKASTEPDEFKNMVNSIRHIEKALGSGLKKPSLGEKKISNVVLKRIVANRYIPIGKVLEAEDLAVKRNDRGLSADKWDLVIGTIAHRNYQVDEGIDFK